MSASRSRWWWPTARRSPRTRSTPSRSRSSRCRRWPTAHAARDNASLLFEAAGTNRAVRYAARFGDADAAFAKAEYTRRESFRCHRLTAAADGDARPASPNGTRRTAGSRSSAPPRCCSSTAASSRRMLGLAEDAIDMIELDVGGGFGVRGEFYPEDFLIPFAARLVGRPVKWIEDRREHLMATNHSREVECELEIACARDGTILGTARPRLRRHGRLHAHQRRRGAGARSRSSCRGRTASATSRIDGRAVRDQQDAGRHLCGARAVRGELLPRAAVRHRGARSRPRPDGVPPQEPDHAKPELPFPTGKLVPYEPETEFDTGDYHATFERALDARSAGRRRSRCRAG